MQKKRIEQARRAEARDARLNARDREIVRRVRAGDNTASHVPPSSAQSAGT